MTKLQNKVKYYFYILCCKDKTLYCGMTRDLKNREIKHNSGSGSVYVKSHGGGRIVYHEPYKSIGDALRREMEVKKWTRAKKLSLIRSN